MTNNNAGILTDPHRKPDKDAILKEWGAMEKMWDGALKAKAEAYSYYTQDYDIWGDFNKGRKERTKRASIHTPMDVAIIKNAVNAHLAYHPTFHRHPNGEGETHATAATNVEKALTSLMVDAFNKPGSSQPGIPTKVNGTELMLTSHTTAFIGWDWDALKRPEKKEGEEKADFQRREWEWESRHLTWNPIKIEVPAPGEVLFNSTDTRPTVAIRRKKMRAYELAAWTMDKQGKGLGTAWDMKDRDPYDEITVMERWTSRWVAVMHENDLLAVEDNTYWMQPFIQQWAGDVVSIAGKEFSIEQWVRQAMMFRVMDTLRVMNQNIAAKHSVLINGAYAKTIYAGDAREYAEQQEGDIIGNVNPDDVSIEKLPTLPGQMFAESEELRRNLELGTYSSQAAGFKETGVRTATEALSLAQNVSRVFLGTVNRLEAMYSILGSYALWLHYRLAQEYGEEYEVISMGTHRLKVKDLGDPPKFHAQAKFEQIDVAVREAERVSAMEEVKRGIIDLDTYYTRVGYENGSEIKKGVVKDRVAQMPEVLAEQEITALIAMGYEELAKRKKEEAMQRRAQIGLVGPDGAPIAGANGQPVTPPMPGGNGVAR